MRERLSDVSGLPEVEIRSPGFSPVTLLALMPAGLPGTDWWLVPSTGSRRVVGADARLHSAPGAWPSNPAAEKAQQTSYRPSLRRRLRRRSAWRRPVQAPSRPLRRVSRVHRFLCVGPWLLSDLEIIGIIVALI